MSRSMDLEFVRQPASKLGQGVEAVDQFLSHRLHVRVDLACVALDLLRKMADALGTTKLTLFVPVPVRTSGAGSGPACVNKPIAVCPADQAGAPGETRGIGVLMPLTPSCTGDYYNRVRDLVTASERRAAAAERRAG